MNDNNEILGPSSSPEVGELTTALAKAQSEYHHVALDSANPHFKSRFSSYATCCAALRGPLTKHGLALPDFRPGRLGSEWILVGTLRHTTGQYITGICPLVNPKGDMQGFGAAMTYAKRTLLMALCGGFSGEADTDGEDIIAEVPKKPVAQSAAPANSQKSLHYEQGAKSAIAEAKDIDAARRHLQVVELRVREKAIDSGVYRRCKAEFDRVWNKESESNG